MIAGDVDNEVQHETDDWHPPTKLEPPGAAVLSLAVSVLPSASDTDLPNRKVLHSVWIPAIHWLPRPAAVGTC